jgi:hypothetical protein
LRVKRLGKFNPTIMREPELQIIEHIDTPENPDWDIINLEICEIWEKERINSIIQDIQNQIQEISPEVLIKIHQL